MATCNVNTLLAAGAAFQGLDNAQIRIAQIALLVSWLQTISGGADVTPSGILSRGKDYQRLSDQDLRTCMFQSLCTISGG